MKKTPTFEDWKNAFFNAEDGTEAQSAAIDGMMETVQFRSEFHDLHSILDSTKLKPGSPLSEIITNGVCFAPKKSDLESRQPRKRNIAQFFQWLRLKTEMAS